MGLVHYFWHRQPAIDAALLRQFADFIGPGKVVVDVGAGYDPWPYATEFVDYEAWPELAGKVVRTVDLECDPLPYADKSVDFLYCRHTIEDMGSPALLLREINRVAKAGYIETPSPMAEFCRGVAGTFRGYSHHRWFVWVDAGVLTLVPKYIAAEMHPPIPGADEKLEAILSGVPIMWNTYLGWRGSFSFNILRHTRDFDLRMGHNYLETIRDGMNVALASVRAFNHEYGLEGAPFTFTGTSAEGPQDQHSPQLLDPTFPG